MLYCKSLGYEKFTSNPTFLQDFTTGFLLGSRYGKILPIKLKLVGMQSKIFYQIFFLSQLGPLQCVWHKKSQIKSKLKFGKYWAGPPTEIGLTVGSGWGNLYFCFFLTEINERHHENRYKKSSSNIQWLPWDMMCDIS